MSEAENKDEFLAHFLQAQPAVRGYLLAVTRDPAETDDLFQEVASVLWRKYEDFDRTRSFQAWAMGMARMQLLKRRQSLARSRLVFSEEAVAKLAMSAAEMESEDARLSHLLLCLKKLPSDHKVVVDFRFSQNQPLAEIAARLGKSVAAVEMMMVRIRRWLRDCVERSMAMAMVTERGRGT